MKTCCALLFAVSLALSLSVSAQSDKTITLSADETATFSKAAAAIASKSHVCMVFEDAPITTTLAQGKELTGSLPPDEAIRRLAEAYDYEISPPESGKVLKGVFALRKRFTDYRDLPDIPFAEMQIAQDDITRFAQSQRSGAPIVTLTNAALDIADALTKEELAALPQTGVPITSLSQTQRNQASRLSVHLYLQDIDGILRSGEGYLGRVKKRGRVQKEKRTDYPAYPDMNGQPFLGVGLPGGDAFTDFTPCYPLTTREWLTKMAREAKERKAQTPAEATTLRDALVRLAKNHDGYTLGVSEALATKRVCVFGGGNADPAVVARAMALIYGLGVQSLDAKTVHLIRPRFKPVRSVAEFRERIIQLRPGPLARYLGFREIETWKLNPIATSRLGTDPEWEKLPPQAKHQAETLQRSWRIAGETWARMAPAFQAAEKESVRRAEAKSGKPYIPFDTLNAETQDMFALFWFNRNLMTRLQEFPVEVPEYISRFEEATIKVGWKWSEADKDKVFSFDIWVKRPDGTFSGTGVQTNRSTRFPE